jgi:aspartate carbamoyltransferase catalytic subunit
VLDPLGLRLVADVKHARTVQVLVQHLTVWDLVHDVRLTLEPDKFNRKWSPNDQYSSASAYSALFLGRVDILGARQIWKFQMPGK